MNNLIQVDKCGFGIEVEEVAHPTLVLGYVKVRFDKEIIGSDEEPYVVYPILKTLKGVSKNIKNFNCKDLFDESAIKCWEELSYSEKYKLANIEFLDRYNMRVTSKENVLRFLWKNSDGSNDLYDFKVDLDDYRYVVNEVCKLMNFEDL